MFALVMAGACKYGSVRTAGDVALTLPEQVPVLLDSGDLCRLGAATSGDTALARCDAFDRSEPIYARAARSLASYGLALKELSGAGQIPAADLVSGLVAVGDVADISTLDDDQRTALGLAVRIIVDLFAEGYKKRHLRKAVVKSDRAVQCIAHRQLINAAVVKQQIAGLEQDLQAELEDLEILAEQFEGAPPEPAPVPPPPHAEDGDAASDPELLRVVDGANTAATKARKDAFRARRSVVSARRVIAREGMLVVAQARRRVEALERGLRGFAAAHNVLACQPRRIGTLRDGPLAKDVRLAVRCATTERDDKRRVDCGPVWRAIDRNLTCDDVELEQPRCDVPAASPGTGGSAAPAKASTP